MERAVPRFFFNFWDHKAFVVDRQGSILLDTSEVRRAATDQARLLIEEGRANREDRSGWVFEVKDEADRTVLNLSFSDAVQPGSSARGDMPAAGPHARESLMNPDATPGTG